MDEFIVFKLDAQERLLRLFVSLIFIFMFLSSVGCQVIPGESTPPSEIPSSPGDVQMTASPSTPANPGLQSLIEKAKADLARRLSVSVTDIAVVQAESVTWPDSSLGCPQEGMLYGQVLAPARSDGSGSPLL